jgi:hypothetical protein
MARATAYVRYADWVRAGKRRHADWRCSRAPTPTFTKGRESRGAGAGSPQLVGDQEGKRADLVVEVFNAMPDRRLVVVGEGPQLARLKSIAGPNAEIAGYLPRSEYVATVGAAKALVFAGCEDFGIALAEAQACGTPLIAFAAHSAQPASPMTRQHCS